jgi:hypothetical protein
MERLHQLAGGLALRAVDISDPLASALRRELGPPAGADNGLHGSLRLRGSPSGEKSPAPDELTGDAGDGRVVGRSGQCLTVTDSSGWYAVEVEPAGGHSVIAGPGVRTWSFVRDLIRPLVQRSGLDRGVAVAHASTVAVDGAGILIAGWSESGKTETALAMAERGATFVGDKWTILIPPETRGRAAPASLAAYPSSVGIRGWVLPSLPRLSATLGAKRKARLTVGRAAAAVGRGASGIGSLHQAADAILSPVGQLGSIAATLRLPAAAIRATYSQPSTSGAVPLAVAIVLTTVAPGTQPTIGELDPAVAAGRLARSGAYERRAFHLIGERAGMLFPDRAPLPGFGAIGDETTVIADRLAGIRTFELRAPFPSDPGIGANLIYSVI